MTVGINMYQVEGALTFHPVYLYHQDGLRVAQLYDRSGPRAPYPLYDAPFHIESEWTGRDTSQCQSERVKSVHTLQDAGRARPPSLRLSRILRLVADWRSLCTSIFATFRRPLWTESLEQEVSQGLREPHRVMPQNAAAASV